MNIIREWWLAVPVAEPLIFILTEKPPDQPEAEWLGPLSWWVRSMPLVLDAAECLNPA